jgi:hypothetical protein
MDRRTFIGTLTGGLLVAPLTTDTQQAGTMHRVTTQDGHLAPVEPYLLIQVSARHGTQH